MARSAAPGSLSKEREPCSLAEPIGRHGEDDAPCLETHQKEGEDVQQEDAVSQTAKLWMRTRGSVAMLALRAIVMAKATRARTGERCSRSAMIHTPKLVTNSKRLPPNVPVTNGKIRRSS